MNALRPMISRSVAQASRSQLRTKATAVHPKKLYESKSAFKKDWLSDPSTYPIIAIMGCGLTFMCGMGLNALTYRGVNINPNKRGSMTPLESKEDRRVPLLENFQKMKGEFNPDEKKVLPPDHPNIIVTYSNLGEIHRQRNEWEDAAEMYGEALGILKKKHAGVDNPDVASTLNTIGLIHDQRGDTCLSLHYLQDALLMRRRLMAKNVNENGGCDQWSLDVAATLVYIGTILYRKSLFPVAIELYTESLQIRQKILGKDHRDTAFVLYNIALVHQQRGDYEQSIEFYTETLRIEKIVLGDRHKDVCMTLFKLGEVKKAAGNLTEALQCFQESLEIERGLPNNPPQTAGRRQKQSGPDPAAMARTLTEIGNIHLTQGDVVPMMDAFNEASRLYRSAGLSPHNIVVSGHLYALEFAFPEAAPAA